MIWSVLNGIMSQGIFFHLTAEVMSSMEKESMLRKIASIALRGLLMDDVPMIILT